MDCHRQFEPTKRKATIKAFTKARFPRQHETAKELWMNKNMTFQPMYIPNSSAATLKPTAKFPFESSSAAEAHQRTPTTTQGSLVCTPSSSIRSFRWWKSCSKSCIHFTHVTPRPARHGLYGGYATEPCYAREGLVLALSCYPGIVRELELLAVAKSFDVESSGVANDLIHFAIWQLLGPNGYGIDSEPHWSWHRDGDNV